ncbi:MAG TPA: hypothetical protein VND93_34245 [Myxococcales bacterium]|nr:hypothetical protein [Myxococcales bacterium]
MAFRIPGRSYVVEFRLIQHLDVQLARSGGQAILKVSGSAMESARVFQELRTRVDRQVIELSVLSCLPFWRRGGSPDFNATRELPLAPGTYEIRYLGPDGQATPIKQVMLE